MAQYDVFANPSHSTADGIPYVSTTRMTIPLAAMKFEGKVLSVLSPAMVVKGQPLHALARYAALSTYKNTHAQPDSSETQRT